MLHLSITSLLTFFLLTLAKVTKDNCKCTYHPETPWIGPYCSNWNNDNITFCNLARDPNSKSCSGAVKSVFGDFYWTENRTICAKSSDYVKNNCNCKYYKNFYHIGPFCAKWNPRIQFSFCLLSGDLDGRFCPGAIKVKSRRDPFYLTTDKGVCKRASKSLIQNCHCTHYRDFDQIGPYCSKWVYSTTPFCLLSGGSDARFCPDALKFRNNTLYLTSNKGICKRSFENLIQQCNCTHLNNSSNIGPYCAKWFVGLPPFCLLSGGSTAKYCPGAAKIKNYVDLYYTRHQAVCNKSIHPDLNSFNLNVRQSFSVNELLQLCLYSTNFLVGAVGNALVIRKFGVEDNVGRPGSRFVIILAFLDLVSSILIPGVIIIQILYRFHTFSTWPLGEFTCRIIVFYPILLHSTSWLLLAVTVERARLIYKPFSRQVNKKIVFLCSIVILLASFTLTLKGGINYRYLTNRIIYIDGTSYKISQCLTRVISMHEFIDTFVVHFLGYWLPMFLILMVYILMYLKLKKHAELTRQNSTFDFDSQMQNVSHTFTIVVVVYYICYLPHTILRIVTTYNHTYNRVARKEADTETISSFTITSFLILSNSSMNPIIYSRIHDKIYKRLRNFIVPFTQKYFHSNARSCRSQPFTITSSEPQLIARSLCQPTSQIGISNVSEGQGSTLSDNSLQQSSHVTHQSLSPSENDISKTDSAHSTAISKSSTLEEIGVDAAKDSISVDKDVCESREKEVEETKL